MFHALKTPVETIRLVRLTRCETSYNAENITMYINNEIIFFFLVYTP